MQRFKIITATILVSFLSACTNNSHTDSVTALTQWDNTYTQCSNEQKISKAVFPANNWFDNLSMLEKKKVTEYLYQLKMYECIGKEQETLKNSLESEENETLLSMFTGLGLFKTPNQDLVKDLDKKQLNDFSTQIPIFNLRVIGDQQGFYK